MSLREHGVKKFGRLIDQDVAKAAYLSERIEQSDKLRLLPPTCVNIVCFLYDPGDKSQDELKVLNTGIMLRLQEEDKAVLSDTTVHGSHCLLAAINNHATLPEDLNLLVAEGLRIGDSLNGGS
jgi:aromatic-L-amino-acid decarboxylase